VHPLIAAFLALGPHALPGAALLSAAHAYGARVHLCATLFNSAGGAEVSAFLANPVARATALLQLVLLAPDGVNLDFEFVPAGSRRRRSGPYPGVHARKSSWFRRSTAWRR